MSDSLQQRSGPQSQALHYSYEKAGLILDNQPIPWNAEAVLVEVQVRFSGPRTREDFVLRLPEPGPSVPAEEISSRSPDRPDLCRVFFRLPVPARTTNAEILWRGQSRGQLTLPILRTEDFLCHLTLQSPTLSVQLAEATVPCQAAVTTQCQGFVASAVVSSATSLVPILDLGLVVRMLSGKGDVFHEEPIRFSHGQLRGRQALAAVVLPRPRRAGDWLILWQLGDKILAEQRFTTFTKTALNQSLRLSGTRFVLQYSDGKIRLASSLPKLEGIERIGPCFWVASSLPGMAGWCDLEVLARLKESDKDTVLYRQKMLVSDGPTPVALGTLDAAGLQEIKFFELRSGNRVLGTLPLDPFPTSTFTSEGGFKPVDESTPWSARAEEQLCERLSKLLGR